MNHLRPATFRADAVFRYQLEEYAREQADVDAQLERLSLKLEETEAADAIATTAIQQAQQICDEAGYTTIHEVKRLQRKLLLLLR